MNVNHRMQKGLSAGRTIYLHETHLLHFFDTNDLFHSQGREVRYMMVYCTQVASSFNFEQ